MRAGSRPVRPTNGVRSDGRPPVRVGAQCVSAAADPKAVSASRQRARRIVRGASALVGAMHRNAVRAYEDSVRASLIVQPASTRPVPESGDLVADVGDRITRRGSVASASNNAACASSKFSRACVNGATAAVPGVAPEKRC